MKDAPSLPRVKQLHPKIRDEVIFLIEKIEFSNPKFCVRIVQGLRTIEYQNDLYAQGRTKPGQIVTKAKGGSSFHNYGLALDFAIMYDKDGDGKYETLSWDIDDDLDKDGKADWMEIVEAFKAQGYDWGGDWHSLKDYPHLEKSFGNTCKQLLEKYNNKYFIPGTQYVNI